VAAADGSYSLGPSSILPDASKFRLEHCFMVRQQALRVKVVQKFLKDWSTATWRLYSVELHKEK
jgi:hypothetical protein